MSVGVIGVANADDKIRIRDREPQRYQLSARASELDSRVKAHPEINFLIDTEDGKPADVQQASVDTRVEPRGKLVIWLMGYNAGLFERWNSYGLHAIRPHYANQWFSICCQEKPIDEQCRGNIRLEAATGEDFSDAVDIPKPDGMAERSLQFVKWLAKENKQAGWNYFLTDDGNDLRWEHVIISGSSHGSTHTAQPRQRALRNIRKSAAWSRCAVRATIFKLGRHCPQRLQKTVTSVSATCSTAAGPPITTAALGKCSACTNLARSSTSTRRPLPMATRVD